MTRGGRHTDTDGSDGLASSRRSLLRILGGTGVGLGVGVGAFAGVASAHEVDTIAFCGCTQVTVYGKFLTGNPPEEEDISYQAVLYCDGDVVRRDLTGDSERQNYDLDDDESLDSEDCQIIAIEGTNWDGSGTVEFTICNTHCPANCASKGLEETDLDCDDPSDLTSPTYGSITIQCGGCGRDEPGNPGRRGPPEDPGRS